MEPRALRVGRVIRAVGLVAVAVCGGFLGGCSSPPENMGRFSVSSGRYNEAIDASRSVLTSLGFDLDRVDAAGGVVSTRAKRTAGIATFWDGEQSTFRQEWEDLINRQSRKVRVVFELADQADAGEQIDLARGDLRDADAAGVSLVGRVEAVVYRHHRAHRRLETEAMWLSSYAGDPLMQRRHGTIYEVARERDSLLERRIARSIGQRLETKDPSER